MSDTLEQAMLESELALANETLITPVNEYLLIDPETRLIEVPESESLFGVYSENDVEVKHFACPKIVLNNIDLFQMYIFINYVSASGRYGQTLAKNIKTSEDGNYITFDWELTGNVFDLNTNGKIYFAVMAKKQIEDKIPVFATRKASGDYYETIEAGEVIQEQHADIILEMLTRIEALERGGTGGSSFNGKASDVSYDDTKTKLGVDNVQDAISKVSEEIDDLKENGVGSDGADGEDGFSPSATVTQTDTGATISITDKNGTTTATITNGKDGKDGEDGYTPVKGKDYFDGSNGLDGSDGKDGYTPIKGTDYWTEEDKQEIQTYIDNEMADLNAQGIQQTPLFANSVEDMTDISKVYVLKETNEIWGYILTEVEVKPTYTNKLPLSTNSDGSLFVGTNGEKGYKTGYRLSSSGSEKAQTGCSFTGYIEAKAGDVIRIKNIASCVEGYHYIHGYSASFTKVGIMTPAELVSGGTCSITLSSNIGDCKYIRISGGLLNENSIVTVNEEITEGGTTTGYAWANTGHAFVPADYEARIISLEEDVEDLKENGFETKSDLMFISPDGNDNNNGLTANTPKKTVKACVNAGAKRISAKRGVYNEIVFFTNIDELEIFPTDNDQTYSTTEELHPIVFDVSDSVDVSSLASYNSIKRIAYSNSNNTQFDKVFIAKSQPPIVSDYGSRYNSTVWLLSNDEKTVCIKLKPVLTVAECEAETNTFTYVGGYIYINANMTGVEKIVVPTNWENGFYISGARKIVLREVEAKFSGGYNLHLGNCPNVDLYKCSCKYTSYGSGFHPVNVNGVFNNCYATKNYDGFGVNGYGHTTHIDCVSEFNFDDGVSHHNGSKGTFIGGRYEGNGKGGNTPAYGAEVNIYGGLYKDNDSFGIGYLYTSTHNPAHGIINGAVMVGNAVGVSVQANCDVSMLSCVLKDNTTERDIKGTLIEYGTVRS